MRPEEEWLLQSIQGGSKDDFARLLAEYRPLLHAVVFARTGDLPGSARRVAAAYAPLWERLHADPAPVDLPGEVRRAAESAVGEVVVAGAAGDDAGSGLPESEKLRLHRALIARVAGLDEQGRAVFVLRYLYRLPYAEIARLLGMAPTDSRTQVQSVHAVIAAELDRLAEGEGAARGMP